MAKLHKQRETVRTINDLYFVIIFMMESENSVDSVGCRAIVDNNTLSNLSIHKVNESTDGVLRNCSPFLINHLQQFIFRICQWQGLQTTSNHISNLFDWSNIRILLCLGKHLYGIVLLIKKFEHLLNLPNEWHLLAPQYAIHIWLGRHTSLNMS